jgi:RNA polymerase sigma-70 factor (ECF subfamily)
VPRFSPASALTSVFVREDARRLPLTESEFLAMYARTAGPLCGYLRRLTGDAALAEDLLQDAYIRFLSVGRPPESDEHQKNYLYRIATNLARDHFRATKRHATVEVGEVSTGAAPNDARDVWTLLARLSARDRELLLLAYVEGLTHQEIANVTGLMRASVRPLLFRARKRFGSLLSAAGLAPISFGGRA